VEKINAEFVTLYREPKFVDYLEKQAVLRHPRPLRNSRPF
jgi:hypothetical protein